MNSVERAVILAAGLGTRLKWLTRDKPKALMQVAGGAAIVHVIRGLAAQGVHSIVINLHHHGDMLVQYLGDGSRWGVDISFSWESQLLDSGGGVKKALEHLPSDGMFVVHNADIISDIDIQMLANTVVEPTCSIALVTNPLHHPKGDFALEKNHVRATGKHCYTFAGVSIWDEAYFLELVHHHSHNTPFSLVEPIRQSMAKQHCFGMLHHGYWYDIGRPRDLMAARREIARG